MIVAIDQFTSLLVSEVLAASCDFSVQFRQRSPGSVIPMGLSALALVPLPAADRLLSVDVCRFGVAKQTRVRDGRAVIGEGGEVSQSEVDTHRLCGFGQRLRLDLTDEEGIPVLTLAFNGALLGLAHKRPMPSNLDLAYFEERQAVVGNLDAVAPLREDKGVEPSFGLEAGEALVFGFLFTSPEEVLVGLLQAYDDLLQDLRMYVLDRFCQRLMDGKEVGLVLVGEAEFLTLPGLFALSQTVVIEVTTHFQRGFEASTLFIIGL